MRSLSKSGYNGGMSTDAIQYESLSGFTPPSTLGPYRAADYWKLPEGEPVELIRGRFVVSPAPDTIHQTVAGFSPYSYSALRERVGDVHWQLQLTYCSTTTQYCNPIYFTCGVSAAASLRNGCRARPIY